MGALEQHLRRQIEHSRSFFWHRLRWRAAASYLPARRPFRLVDVGAGIGLAGDFLRRDFPQAEYRFVEPIPFLRGHLEERFGAEANVEGRERYEGCGYALLLDVLEHQEDDAAFMADFVGRLDPGATLIVTVPALQGLWSGWDVALGHYRRYDRDGFRRAVAGLPVEVVELSYLFPELLPPALARRALRRVRAEAQPAEGSAEFPDLPRILDEAVYRAGTVSLRLRRRWPAGTSLLAVLRCGAAAPGAAADARPS